MAYWPAACASVLAYTTKRKNRPLGGWAAKRVSSRLIEKNLIVRAFYAGATRRRVVHREFAVVFS